MNTGKYDSGIASVHTSQEHYGRVAEKLPRFQQCIVQTCLSGKLIGGSNSIREGLKQTRKNKNNYTGRTCNSAVA